MADINILADSTTELALNDDSVYVAPGVSLVTNAEALTLGGVVARLTNLGAVFSHTEAAIVTETTVLELYVGSTGFISGTTVGGVSAQVSARGNIVNHGEIAARGEAGGLSIFDGGDQAQITIANFGSIHGDFAAISINTAGDGSAHITNTGLLSGGERGISSSGETFFVNHGLLSVFDGTAYLGQNGNHALENHGTIDNAIETQEGDDSLTNTGLVAQVELGQGNDTYEGRGGRSTAEVRGQGGEDTLRGGNEADLLFGGTGDDVLRGRKDGDELDGGDGSDKLHGNKGDDTLTGGDNGDTFVFKANGGFDTITDFGGNDEINLKGLGLRRFSKDIRDNIQDVKDGSIVDLDKDYGLVIFLQGVDADDLSSSDFIL